MPFLVRHRLATLWTGLAVALALTLVAAGALNSFVLSRWEAPGSASVRAEEILGRDFATGNANLILLVTARDGTVDDPDVHAAATALGRELAADPQVGDVWSYWSQERDPTLRSRDARQAVVLAWVTGDATTTRAHIRETLLPTFTRTSGPLDVRVAGAEAVSAQVSEQASRDFVRAELLIVPLMLLLLVALYRRVRPALLTLGIGLFAVVTTLAALRLLTSFVEVSTFAANITLVMGIGLGVDYSLFLIARFREELTGGAAVPDAVATTLRTAGRTVVFSGLTVAASLAALLALPYPFLRSFGYAGVLTVLSAMLGALVLLPAALAVLGHRVLRRPRRRRRTADGDPRPADDGDDVRAGSAGAGSSVSMGGSSVVGGGGDRLSGRFWRRAGEVVTRRPVLFSVAGLLLVGTLAAPAAGLRIGLPDDRVLPPSASTRTTYDALRAAFGTEANDAVHLIAPDGRSTPPAAVARYAAALSAVPGVAQVNSTAGVYADGERVRAAVRPERLLSPDGVRLEAVPTRAVLAGTEAGPFLDRVRAVPSPFGDDLLVGGYPAELTDFRAALADRIPLVALLILGVTFVLLTVATRSLLLPVKATVLNLLSLAAMFGVLVFVFQNGAFADVLGFTPIGTLDPAFPILMFCVAYGLSMDYEVFLLTRIAERYRATGDNRLAVREGLERSAPLVTAAAVILAVSFALYATGDVMYLQMIGVGTALAILVDATVIRAVLVPGLMVLAGPANWWFPSRRRGVPAATGSSARRPCFRSRRTA
ncbi:MMPL family transporter [Cryptosporangium aurantiacum]|uniref:Putative drug exporter of the RND superfamily n=1 Tax=Cryptosporangium aurantiacum TaxID=134849 RepID=A0A1M7RBF5_9ACTN|nr:MMPL family transporter [Cryptosporangium aurantiacum]SHN43614.1 putative drug exporter of the RND superfamily [Cryptosporangium aurantiacum]